MKATFILAAASLVIFVSTQSVTATWYVDDSVAVSGDGTSWETAFRKIQEGIDAASDGDTVIVGQGTYQEYVQFNGKNVALRSTDPLYPAVVAGTIITGRPDGCLVIEFSDTEEESCLLSGFTILNGDEDLGAIRGNRTHATIENCVVTRSFGPGIVGCDGLIQNNVISDNSGHGLWGCDGLIQDNIIRKNSLGPWGGSGGGLYDCQGTIQHNIITGNSSSSGGGLADCDGTIRNNIIAGNVTYGHGGGLSGCSAVILNNTIFGNSAAHGGGLSSCSGIIRNCIIWGNAAQTHAQLESCPDIAFSCIEGWTGEGPGNIIFYPHFVDSENGDFHLRPCSPCIDAGHPASPFSNEPEPNGGRADMGAYGNTSEATSISPDTDSDALPDEWEGHWFGGLTEGPVADLDGDRIINLTEYRFGTNPTEASITLVENVTDGLLYATIRTAMATSRDGDEIVVHAAVYSENVDFGGRNVVLRSADPDDPAVVASTVIDGGKRGPCVAFNGTENDTCVLAGFTIRNGESSGGGGILGGTRENPTHAIIRGNAIMNNDGRQQGGGFTYCDGLIQDNSIFVNVASYGAGISRCNGIIEANTISDNSASADGGGLYECDGIIRNNTISRNVARKGGGLESCDAVIDGNIISDNIATRTDGGGFDYCQGRISGNIVTGNSAKRSGGGLSRCDRLIENNTISGNTADNAGGVRDCNGVIQNNMIVMNSARVVGGMKGCSGTIRNNTIVANSTQSESGGLYWCKGTIENCIIWDNGGESQLSECSIPSFSCIQDWTGGGEGNTASDPLFHSLKYGDYHLQSGSPCIDTGGIIPCLLSWPQRDLDGNCRFVGDNIDMGCYEYGSSPDSDGDYVSDARESSIGTNPELVDTDSDGVVDGLELLRETDPTSPSPPAVIRVPGETRTIQRALRVALTGDEVVVAPGIYRVNLRSYGCDLILRSENPLHPKVVASTVLDGGGAGSVVTLTGQETEACVISGFTIRNGSAENGGGIYGGPMSGLHSHATIRNNRITGNTADYGGGLASCNGLIENNIISGNSNNGLAWCHGTIRSNLVSANSADQDSGGGLHECSGTIENNTIVANSASNEGGGLWICRASIRNCIIWGNSAATGAQIFGNWLPTYSCIQGWTDGGEGNTADDPLFIDADGADNDPHTYEDNDYRLDEGSPCIDKGVNQDWMSGALDLDGNPRLWRGSSSWIVDMGAYEYGSLGFKFLTVAQPSDGRTRLTWKSRSGDTYTVQSCTDLSAGQWNEERTLSSQGDITSWTDPDTSSSSRKFYRIGVQ